MSATASPPRATANARLAFALAIALLTAAMPGPGARAADDLHEQRRWLMGTEFRLVLVGAGDAAPRIAERVFADVTAVEESLSIWDPATPLSRLNRAAPKAVRISDFLAGWIERCRADHERTDGAFDPSVGSWRGLDSDAPRLPIGMDRVEIRRSDQGITARLPRQGFALDSGGNGKGLAVDRAVAILREEGVRAALIDFGGSSWYGLGRPPEGSSWEVLVPGVDGRPAGRVALADAALSVSDARQRDRDASGREVVRWHIVDPRTGEPVRIARVAVVRAPSAVDAEVLSTALVVDGRAAADAFAHYEGALGFLLDERQRTVPAVVTP